MLAVVARSLEAANVFEKYTRNEVDSSDAQHAAGAEILKSIKGRYMILCLEDIRLFKIFPDRFSLNFINMILKKKKKSLSI